MKLTFNKTELEAVIAHVKSSKKFQKTYGREGTDVPGVWLVGDEGVYIMSNGIDNGKSPIAYANEVNPKICDFDTWWANKRASFGGDDGAEFIPLKDIEGWVNPATKEKLTMQLSKTQFKLYS